MKKNAIILLSGGIDSATAAYYIKKRIKPKKLIFLFFDYGQRALKEERFCVKKLAKLLKAELKIINLKWLGDISTSLVNIQKKVPKTKERDLKDVKQGQKEILRWWVPCRNSIFILAGLAHAESLFISEKEKYDIYIGLKSEGRVHFKDTTSKFIKKVNTLAKEATHHGKYKILAPLIKYDKDEIVKLGEKLKVPWIYTYSCYIGTSEKGKPIHCGDCLNCKLRQKAFYWANIPDPSIYKN